jgi:hypothetical protein
MPSPNRPGAWTILDARESRPRGRAHRPAPATESECARAAAWYVRAAVRRGRGIARCGVAGALAISLAAPGCGGDKRTDANERKGDYTLEIVKAEFPRSQRLADKSRFEITVRNADNKTLPNVAVTIEPAAGAQPAQAFGQADPQQGLADPSRPLWIVDSGPVGGTTAYTNTWALGPLRPGEEKTFTWNVTAVKAGQHTIRYRIAAGLSGKAKARLAGGQAPEGSFTVDVSGRPADTRVDDSGRVVTNPSSTATTPSQTTPTTPQPQQQTTPSPAPSSGGKGGKG